ncbi:MAG: ABC transporter ATP-binding protein [Bacteroidetes bacterium]|nr:MAG: ABC transporter ATP-binding protein [Bacteroidota bacterium]
MSKNFKTYQQRDSMECGIACLKMVAMHHGREVSWPRLRQLSHVGRLGVSLLGISRAAETLGFKTLGVSISLEQLVTDAPLPAIVHWNQQHFVVVYKATAKKIYVADPAHGLVTFTPTEFVQHWQHKRQDGQGVALLLEPTPQLQLQQDEKAETQRFGFLFRYLTAYKKLIGQLFLGLLVGSVLQLIFPFLTQAVVDIGINQNNLNFIYVVLAAQLMLFFSSTAVQFIRSWILLHISARVNIRLASDFLFKLMKLPIAFFDAKMHGDIMQRINDNRRIENFLTAGTLNTLFSMVNLLLFGGVLLYYNWIIFTVFMVGSALYITWVLLFLKRRKELDYKQFNRLSENQSALIQLISGMQEIKLHTSESQFRWQWEDLQARLYKISVESLKLEQSQSIGASTIDQLKNIIITFLAAKFVLDGAITLGMMLSIQYIIGQLNNPISQLIGFIQSAQDAKISLERLGEIREREDEIKADETLQNTLPPAAGLQLTGLNFRYGGPDEALVLADITLHIPHGKTTAIVGSSGSGKTTLLKLLLQFYPPEKGEIKLGAVPLQTLHPTTWRQSCGTVMQEGYIFNDTIAKNIAIGVEEIDRQRLDFAANTANIKSYIEELPMGYQTKIGVEGQGLSSGQKQRLLIARSVYKNPEYLFFDEATNALDANNEKVIMENLNRFFEGKTVVVVAHRLSTVQNADKIVVLEQGQIAEEGTHNQLTAKRGKYYELVKNQLELGN